MQYRESSIEWSSTNAMHLSSFFLLRSLESTKAYLMRLTWQHSAKTWAISFSVYISLAMLDR